MRPWLRTFSLVSLAGFTALIAGSNRPDFPELGYQLVAGWGKLPQGWNLGPTTGIGVDSQNNVYVFHRGPHPVICFSSQGDYLRSWGDGIISGPHGLAVDPDDNIWVTDIGSHTVLKFSTQGHLLMVLGQKDSPGEDKSHFDQPTHVAFGLSGEVYVTDGYGNSRVVKFSQKGKYLLSWGRKGTEPGEFNAPHTIAVDDQGRVYVGDRENHRLQIFDENGKFLTQWTHLGSPWGLSIDREAHLIYLCDGYQGRVLKLDLEGQVIGTFGSFGRAPGELSFAHHLSLGQGGELYVAEVLNWRVEKFVLK